MILRYELQIQTMVKAMTDTVLPAVDPNNELAQEQGQLIISTLKLIAQQLPLQYRFDCDDLTRVICFANDLAAILDDCPGPLADSVSTLTGSIARSCALLSDSFVDPAEIVAAAREVRTTLDQVVDTVFTDDSARKYRDDVQRVVLDQSRDEITRDRVWSRGQGLDAGAQHLPMIESLLSSHTPTAVTNE